MKVRNSQGSKITTVKPEVDEAVKPTPDARLAELAKAERESKLAEAKTKAEAMAVERAQVKARREEEARIRKDERLARQAETKAEREAAKMTRTALRSEAKAKKDAERAEKKARIAAAHAPKPCGCGCGGMTKSKFLPGHDSKFHSWIVKSVESKDATVIKAMLDKLGIQL